MTWVQTGLMILSVIALVVLNGLFVAAEFSLVAVRRTRIEELVRRGVKSARAAESALRHMDRTIAATQLGVTLASIGLGWLGEVIVVELLRETGWGFLALHS